MAYSKEELENFKRQILDQTKGFPEDRKKEVENQINSMSDEQLEMFVNQQMSSQSQAGDKNSPQKGIFRSIIDGDIKSMIVEEGKNANAYLDIKPISLGHVIIIPKDAVTESKNFPVQGFNLAKKIVKRIEKKLGSKGAEIQTEFKFGEVILNVIPIYNEPLNVNSPRNDAKEDELNSILNKIKYVKKKRVEKIKIKREKTGEILKLKRRIA